MKRAAFLADTKSVSGSLLLGHLQEELGANARGTASGTWVVNHLAKIDLGSYHHSTSRRFQQDSASTHASLDTIRRDQMQMDKKE